MADGAPYVFWVEGEPCVDVLSAIGLFAVTSIGGAGKFKPERDAGHLPADRLVLVPDRDKPGFKHAEDVAAAYPGCQWLFPFPDTPQRNDSMPNSGGLDIADWLAQGATADYIFKGIGAKPSQKQLLHQDKGDLPLNELIDASIEDLLKAYLVNDAGQIDAAFAELFKLGVRRERAEECILMLWASGHGLDISTGSAAHRKIHGRVYIAAAVLSHSQKCCWSGEFARLSASNMSFVFT